MVSRSGSLGTRGATGGIRGNSLGTRVRSAFGASGRYSGVSGHVAARRAPGGRFSLGTRRQMATRATSGGNPPGAGHSGTRGSSGRIREVKCFALHSEHVADSEGVSKKAFGGVSGRFSGTRVRLRRGSEGVYRSAFEGASIMTIIDGLGING